MTKVTFETATFADAIKKAERVAPGKGNSFDKAAGIVIEVNPDQSPPVVVRATNLDVFTMQWVDAVEVSGESVRWRLPSTLLSQVIGSLPISSGSHVTLAEVEDKPGHVFIQMTTSGRTKAKFNMMATEDYPHWSAFDPDNLLPVEGLGGRIDMVEWAAAPSDNTPVLAGIHFDGEQCVATDRYKLAKAVIKVPGLTEPVTVPAGLLGGILKQTGEVHVGVEGGQFLMMPDQTTQIRAIMYGQPYPMVSRIMQRDQPNSVTIRKGPLLEIIARAMTFAGNDRYPMLTLIFGKEEIAVFMAHSEIGLLGDVVDVPGQALHKRMNLKFSPKNFTDAVNKAPNDEISVHYDVDKPGSIVRIDGGSGYEAWVMQRAAAPEGGDG